MSKDDAALLLRLEQAYPQPRVAPGRDPELQMFQAGGAAAVALLRHLLEAPEDPHE
ncbi:MAG: hypothetical protein V3S01_06955 [Dehalococcoidia bacterium]